MNCCVMVITIMRSLNKVVKCHFLFYPLDTTQIAIIFTSRMILLLELMGHKLWLDTIFFKEIAATLPTTEEDCRLWTFFLNGEELSKETCLRIVHDQDVRQSFQIMIT